MADINVEEVLEQLTLNEKVDLLSGPWPNQSFSSNWQDPSH